MNARYLLMITLLIPFYPFLWIQSKWIKWKVPKLPEAKGNTGVATSSSSKTIRLLAIGESTIAGVGVQTHEEGFAGTMANQLALKLDSNVEWKVYAQRGLTAKRVMVEQVPNISESNADLIVIGLGANDTFKLHAPWKWRKDLQAMIASIQTKFQNTPIVFINMPPIDQFPSLSFGIKIVLGNLVLLLSKVLEEVAASDEHLYYYSRHISLEDWITRLNVKADPSEFFSDGVHPSLLTYQVWAKDVANYILEQENIINNLRQG